MQRLEMLGMTAITNQKYVESLLVFQKFEASVAIIQKKKKKMVQANYYQLKAILS